MKNKTRQIHDKLIAIGEKLGLVPSAEVSESCLAFQTEEKRYVPRVDLVWSIPLLDKQRQAISEVTGRPSTDFSFLPLVGIEVEGSDPTTKTLESDTANILSLGTPFGLLVVSEAGSKNIYHRASRVLRSFQRMYGRSFIFPVESAWLKKVDKDLKNKVPIDTRLKKKRKPSGGEKGWSKKARSYLLDLGKRSGFIISEEWTPPTVDRAYERLMANRNSVPEFTWNPITGERKEIKKPGDFLTASRLDVVWLLRTPPRLIAFLKQLISFDPDPRDYSDFELNDWLSIPVVGFELEQSTGKHAGGGLLNLGAHTIIGVCVVTNESDVRQMRNKLIAYNPVLGLKNVYVKGVK